jgi:hypothetical protein
MSSLRHLKKSTVKEVIRLADLCPAEETFTREEIQAGLRGRFSTDSPVRDFNSFLRSLTEGELAELTALCRVGRDMLSVADWQGIVSQATAVGVAELKEVPKRKLPQYLRLGTERLARFNANKTLPNPREVDARKLLVGEFVLQCYRENYGEEPGIQRLVWLMEEKGFLNDPKRRVLFGLPEESVVDPLDESLRAKKPAAIKVGEIRS